MAAQVRLSAGAQGIFSITAGMGATTTGTAIANAIADGVYGASAASQDAIVIGSGGAIYTDTANRNRSLVKTATVLAGSTNATLLGSRSRSSSWCPKCDCSGTILCSG